MSGMIKPAPVRKQVTVHANRARAFEVFTTGQSSWWPPSHTILKVALKEVVMEPHVGGRWFHRGVDGSECDNGRILAWRAPECVVLGWQLNGRWEYEPDIVSEVEIRFIEIDAQTTSVELEHRHIERFGDTAEALRTGVGGEGGWSSLLQQFAEAAAG